MPALELDVEGKVQLTVVKETDDEMTLTAQASWAPGPGLELTSEPRTDSVLSRTRVELVARAGNDPYAEITTIDPGEEATVRATAFIDDEPARNRTLTYEIDEDGELTHLTVLIDNDGIGLVAWSGVPRHSNSRTRVELALDTGGDP